MNKITKVIIIILIVSFVFSLLSFVGCKWNDEYVFGHENYFVAVYAPVNYDTDDLKPKLNKTVDEIKNLIKYNGFIHFKVELCDNDTKIKITINKAKNVDTFLNMLGHPSKLEFRKEGVDEQPLSEAYVTEKDLARAFVWLDSNKNYFIALRFNAEGTKKFAKATEERMYKSMNIWINDEWVMGPTVNSVITNGEASLNGIFSYEEAYEIATQFQAGALTLQLCLYEKELIEGK